MCGACAQQSHIATGLRHACMPDTWRVYTGFPVYYLAGEGVSRSLLCVSRSLSCTTWRARVYCLLQSVTVLQQRVATC
jgi:hypothetical protein